MNKIYVQYGCGLTAPREWINFDVSPTLRIQKTPILGALFKRKLNIIFPSNVRYGNIVSGLPIGEATCDGVYCSHVLDNLSFEDLKIALRNTFKILKEDGIFRCVIPDLEWAARSYISSLENGDTMASVKFLGYDTQLGVEKRPKNLKGFISSFWGNSRHLWMWDRYSFSEELKKAGFTRFRLCEFNDSEDEMFKLVENSARFIHSMAFECKK
jgi:hypothetical protein